MVLSNWSFERAGRGWKIGGAIEIVNARSVVLDVLTGTFVSRRGKQEGSWHGPCQHKEVTSQHDDAIAITSSTCTYYPHTSPIKGAKMEGQDVKLRFDMDLLRRPERLVLR